MGRWQEWLVVQGSLKSALGCDGAQRVFLCPCSRRDASLAAGQARARVGWGGGGRDALEEEPPPPSRAPGLRPATVPLTATAGCITAPNRFGNLLQPPAQPLLKPPLRSIPL